MSVALTEQVNDEDVRNAEGVLKRHRRRLYPDTRPGGAARCQGCGRPWPCVPVQVAVQVQGVARSAGRAAEAARP